MSPFITDLVTVINRHSMENSSDTPDFILAEYLASCLTAWNEGVTQRARQPSVVPTAAARRQGPITAPILTCAKPGPINVPTTRAQAVGEIDPEALYADVIKEAVAKEIIRQNSATGKWCYRAYHDPEGETDYSDYIYDSGYAAIVASGVIIRETPVAPRAIDGPGKPVPSEEVDRICDPTKPEPSRQAVDPPPDLTCASCGHTQRQTYDLGQILCEKCQGKSFRFTPALKTPTGKVRFLDQAVDAESVRVLCDMCQGTRIEPGTQRLGPMACPRCAGTGFMKPAVPEDTRMDRNALLFHLVNRSSRPAFPHVTRADLCIVLEMLGLLKPQAEVAGTTDFSVETSREDLQLEAGAAERAHWAYRRRVTPGARAQLWRELPELERDAWVQAVRAAAQQTTPA